METVNYVITVCFIYYILDQGQLGHEITKSNNIHHCLNLPTIKHCERMQEVLKSSTITRSMHMIKYAITLCKSISPVLFKKKIFRQI